MKLLSKLIGRVFNSGMARRNRLRPQPFRLTVQALENRIVPATVTVNATSNIHAISPLIYGAAFPTTAQAQDLGITIARDGGNASDTYNYQADATNHGSDWYYESISSGSGNGQGMDSFVSQAQAGGAQPDLTVDIMPYAAKLGSGGSDLGSYPVSVYGPQQSTDPYNSNFGNGVTTGGTNITDTNPLYNYVNNTPALQQAWIQHLISTFGNSQNGGVQYYTLGNEPALWGSTHRDIQPTPETNTELINDFLTYASMIKSVDPNAKILGPEEWGWLAYFADAAGNFGPGGIPVEGAFLQAMQQYQTQNGVRLLDYFTNHIYPQANGVYGNATDPATELLRNETTRDLWDPTYVDPSWIGQNNIDGGIIDLIPTMQKWVQTYYPGTKVGVTEYNWGAEGDMNGATAQADIEGIFGAQGLDLATRWTTPATGSPAYLAMKMYRNYDGSHSTFGDTSVSASVADPDQVDAFAATRSSDGALTIMVINKNLYLDQNGNITPTTPITVNISGFNGSGVAQEWQLAAVNPTDQTNAAISHLANVNYSGNSFTLNVPTESVSIFVIEPATGNTEPMVTTNPIYQTVVAGQMATLTAAATGTPAPTVQWQVSTNGGSTFTNVSGATATTFTFTAAANQNGNQYRAVFTNTAGTATTTSATLSVNVTPSITSNPSNQTVTAGQPATFAAAATGTPTPTVQWQVSTNGGSTFTNVGGATATTFSFTGAANQNGNQYRAVFANSAGTATTTAAILTVDTAPSVTTNPTNQTVNSGQSATFTAAGGGNPTPTVQWQVSTNGGTTFSDVSGANSTTLTFTTAAAQTGNLYHAVFTNSAGTATTANASLTVNTGPVVTTNLSNQTVNTGSSASFTAGASGSPTPTVQWQVSTNGGSTFGNITGATSTTLTFNATAAQTGNLYHAVFTNTVGTATTANATLTVNTTAATPSDLSVTGGIPVLTWSPSSGATSYDIFRSTTPGGEGSTVYQNVTTTTFTDSTVVGGVTYYYQVSAVNGSGQSAKSSEVSTTAISLDVDGNGQVDPLTDGVLILRYLFGFTGTALTSGALGVGAARTDPTAIFNYLNSVRTTMLDPDGNGKADPLTDGVLIVRYMFGFTGTSLTSGALGSGAIRTDPVAIQQYLDSYNPTLGHLWADSAGTGTGPALSSNQLRATISAAISVWEASGITPAQDAALKGASVQIADLSDMGLAQTHANAVLIDRDAAGHGWYVGTASPPPGSVDLLTVVTHELGLVIGYKDVDPGKQPASIMTDVLPAGVRRLPASLMAAAPASQAVPPSAELALVLAEFVPSPPARSTGVAQVPTPNSTVLSLDSNPPLAAIAPAFDLNTGAGGGEPGTDALDLDEFFRSWADESKS